MNETVETASAEAAAELDAAAEAAPVETVETADAISEETVEMLADGFLQLQAEIPEIGAITDLPEAVLQMATTEDLPLIDAYLRYRFREEQAIAAETERQARAAAAAAGSLYTGEGDGAPASAAFTRAFITAIQ